MTITRDISKGVVCAAGPCLANEYDAVRYDVRALWRPAIRLPLRARLLRSGAGLRRARAILCRRRYAAPGRASGQVHVLGDGWAGELQRRGAARGAPPFADRRSCVRSD